MVGVVLGMGCVGGHAGSLAKYYMDGLRVKGPLSNADGPGFNSRRSYTSKRKIGVLVATPPDT